MKTIYVVETGAPFGEDCHLLALCETHEGAARYVEKYIKRARPRYQYTMPNTWSDGYYTITIREKELLQ